MSVIATSSGAAAAYVREGYTNIRIGMFLEVATTVGAVLGAALAGLIPTSVLAVGLGAVLLYSALLAARPRQEHVVATRDPLAARLGLDGSYPTLTASASTTSSTCGSASGSCSVRARFRVCWASGRARLKVLAMDQAMCLPFKVSTTTSNFMIGVTAAASAGIYLARGYIDPGIAMPVMLGVLAGSTLGTRVLARTASAPLRALFAVVIGLLAVEMIVNGIRGRV